MPCIKIPHPTREAAEEHLKRLVWQNACDEHPERSAGLESYSCRACQAWHVGHQRQQRGPLVWHYTVANRIDRITQAGTLSPRKVMDERCPMLWFSWNQEWEHSVLKHWTTADGRIATPGEWPILRSGVLIGRALSEITGDGLIRFGAPAYVAKLRWNDYLDRNKIPTAERDMMAQRGNPVDWLATDKPVSLDECRAIEVYYRGQWVDAGEISADDFDQYISDREDVYIAAWARIMARVHILAKARMDPALDPADKATVEVVTEDESEHIMLHDMMVMSAQRRWAKQAWTERPAAMKAWINAVERKERQAVAMTHGSGVRKRKRRR